jgi:hypothetical protein
MKRCPECRRDYYDETLLYCLEDGVALVQGSVPSHEGPATEILGLGEKEKAYEWLEKGYIERDVEIARLLWAPQFSSLRGDERFVRFQRLVRPD